MNRDFVNSSTSSYHLLKDINPHELDPMITFQDEGHVYFINNVDSKKLGYISTTYFIHQYFSEFNQNVIVRRIMGSKKWFKDTTYEYYLMSSKDILNNWKNSTNMGTELHATIECYLQNIPVNEHVKNSVEFKYFLDFMRDYGDKFTPYRLEMLCFDPVHLITGSIDCLVKYHDGTYGIYDWKRSKSIRMSGKRASDPLSHLKDCNSTHYFLQQSLYKYILETNYGFKIRDCHLVILHPNNSSYVLIKVPDMTKGIELILKDRKSKL
jgi:hypothetical protein